jgi:hypothetical protein
MEKKYITEYHTACHPVPLVFVPNMGLIYFKGESKGHQVHSGFFKHTVHTLDYMLKKGGDFEVVPLPLPQNGIYIRLKNASGSVACSVTVWEVEWTGWWKSFVKMQRRLKYVLWSHHRPSLKLIRAFQETDRAETIPSEIMSKIIYAYFEPVTMTMVTECDNGHRVPVRIIETNSFKSQELCRGILTSTFPVEITGAFV